MSFGLGGKREMVLDVTGVGAVGAAGLIEAFVRRVLS